jgi:hypothetical protein
MSSSASTTTSTTTGAAGDVNVRVVPFKGNKDEWENWKEKFMIKAAIGKYDGIITGEDKVPDTHDKDGKKLTLKPEESIIADLNKKGFGDLIYSIDYTTSEGLIAFNAAKGTKTAENPNGNLFLAIQRLDKKYQPRTGTQLVHLTREFHSMKLKAKQDPEVFITDLEALKLKLVASKHIIDDKALILHILYSLTKDYDVEVKLIEHKMELLEAKNEEITIEEIRSQLSDKYEKLKANWEKSEPTNHAYYMGTRTKLKCNWCGVIGHKASECRHRINGKPRRNNIPNYPRNNNNNYNNNNNTPSVNTNYGNNNNNNEKAKRGDLYCTYCRTKGHDIKECRKKKREENNPTGITKELACMAKQLKKPKKPEMKLCTNINCRKPGLAYLSCEECGETSGHIYFHEGPTVDIQLDTESSVGSQGTIYYREDDLCNMDTDKILALATKAASIDENIDIEDINPNIESEENNIGYRQVPMPTFLKEFHPKYILPEWDEFRRIPIEDLFDEVHEHLNITEEKRNYILRNYATMTLFGYDTIPTIIQNFDNINYNVKLYNNDYLEKLPSNNRPPKLKIYGDNELSLMVKWGVYLIQEHAKRTLQRIPIPLDFNVQFHQKEMSDMDSDAEENTKPPFILLSQPPSTTDNDTDDDMEDTKPSKIPSNAMYVMRNAKWNIETSTNIPINKINLVTKYNENNPTKDLWIGDSGASCHFINTDFGMYNWKNIREEIGVGNGAIAIASKEGSVKLKVFPKNGKQYIVTLHGVKFIPNLQTNLFSITTALTRGWKLSNRGVHIVLKNKDGTIIFDTPDPTTEGLLMTARMVPLPVKQHTPPVPHYTTPTPPTNRCYKCSNMSHRTREDRVSPGDQLFQDIFFDKNGISTWSTTPTTPKQEKLLNTTVPKSHRVPKSLHITHFHNILGHVNERILQNTARHYNYDLHGTLPPCIHCTLANIHRMPLSKHTKTRATTTGERIFIDISQLHKPSLGGNQYWLLIVDDHTDYAWSYFLRRKSDTANTLLYFVQYMRQLGHPIKHIRCDNSGENQKTQIFLKQNKENLQFEFTAPSTPQQNGRVERKFAILYNYMRSMLNKAQLPENLRHSLWAEAAKHATDIVNCLCTSTNRLPPYHMFHQHDPPFFEHLRIFGEVTVLAKHVGFQAKIENKGMIGLYLGRAEDHSPETGRYYNIETQRVILSRDKTPMAIMYMDYFTNTNETNIHHNNPYHVLFNDDDDDEEEIHEDIQQNIPPLISNIPTIQEEEQLEPDDDIMPGLITDEEYQQQQQPVQQQQQIQQQISEVNNPKLRRELRKLDGFFNPEATIMHQQIIQQKQDQQEIVEINHPNPEPDPEQQSQNSDPIFLNTEHEIVFETDDENASKDSSTTYHSFAEQALSMVSKIPKYYLNNKNLQTALGTMNRAYSTFEINQAYGRNAFGNPYGFDPSEFKDKFTLPKNFEEAWFHPDPWLRTMWRKAITLELNKMKELKVWHIIKKNKIPNGRKCIKCKWIFDIKRNGTFRARLVACGYSQQPGIDFQDYFAPVVNDVVFRIIVIIQIIHKLEWAIIDVETAFLHGDLQEEIYMQTPKGLQAHPDECVQLDKALYGLVQAARQFYLKFAKILLQLGFEQSYADPCLFYRNTKNGTIYMIIHIDDCYVIGSKITITELVNDLERAGFKLKVAFKAKDYLSCDINIDKNNTMAWITQSTLLKKVENKFGPLLTTMKNYNYKTPGTPGKLIIRPSDEENSLNPADQKLYRSGIGTLLQFSTKTRPDLANCVRELSKCMDRASPAAFKEMLRVITYLLQTKNYGLKIAPKLQDTTKIAWTLKLFSDSDWAADVKTRRSVTGFVILLNNTPILWRSQTQRTVALSSTEAEYYAMADAVKEIKFILQVLESLHINVEKPIIVYIDNVGAIFVAENASATKHTRHIEARYHFVREFIIDGHIKITFVMSKNNIADMFTKNVTSEILEEHIDNFLVYREIIHLTNSELDQITSTSIVDSGGVSELSTVSESDKTDMSGEMPKAASTSGEMPTIPTYAHVRDYLYGKYKPTYKRTVKVQHPTLNTISKQTYYEK